MIMIMALDSIFPPRSKCIIQDFKSVQISKS